MSDMFEKASRLKLRFNSIKGQLTVEQLWDLPLTAANDFCLDAVAKSINAELKAAGEESFVSTTRAPGAAVRELEMDLVKHIIAVRLAENEAKRNESERATERARIRDVLRERQDKELLDLPKEELEKRLRELGG